MALSLNVHSAMLSKSYSTGSGSNSVSNIASLRSMEEEKKAETVSVRMQEKKTDAAGKSGSPLSVNSALEVNPSALKISAFTDLSENGDNSAVMEAMQIRADLSAKALKASEGMAQGVLKMGNGAGLDISI